MYVKFWTLFFAGISVFVPLNFRKWIKVQRWVCCIWNSSAVWKSSVYEEWMENDKTFFYWFFASRGKIASEHRIQIRNDLMRQSSQNRLILNIYFCYCKVNLIDTRIYGLSKALIKMYREPLAKQRQKDNELNHSLQ